MSRSSPVLLRLESSQPQEGAAEEESLMLGLFLDFLSRQMLSAPSGPVPYTEAMAAVDEDLLVRHGWEIAFQLRLYARHYAELKRLKRNAIPATLWPVRR